MKRKLLSVCLCALLFCGCTPQPKAPDIVATTLPVHEFTVRLCKGSGLSVGLLIDQNVSCLHDYTLQVSQMRMLEKSKAVAVSGAGLEDFLPDLSNKNVIDCSAGISLLDHGSDPHIWLSPALAKKMAENLAEGLIKQFPNYADRITDNLQDLELDLDKLQSYGENALSALPHKELITFHDGFAYFAQSFGLEIAFAIEEEPGSEVSAAKVKELVTIIRDRNIPAIFTEKNGSTASAEVIAAEAGISCYTLDMIFSDTDYFSAMYQNIDCIKEALK